MANVLKWVAVLIAVCGIIWGALFVRTQNAAARIGVGYKVKVTCSEVFLAGRSPDEVLATDFANIVSIMDKIKINVDMDAKSVTGGLFGLGKSKAVYRENVGCTGFAQHGVEAAPIPAPQISNPHIYETAIRPELQAEVTALFDEQGGVGSIMSRGMVVIQNGKIVAEGYRDGYTKDTRQQSWSLAKAFTQSLVGILSGRDLLSVEDTALMPNWQGDDPRASIKLDDLLHMASGLEFVEDYGDMNSAVVQMLFNRKDMGAFASSFPLIHEPGTQSVYSSGTTNIVQKIIRNTLETQGEDYHAFPRHALFDKLSMRSAVFEVDPNGGFIGSSYIYATPRDFARFGQFILQDGVWEGERILPEGWVDYSRQAAPGSNGTYASHWMINLDQNAIPGMPADMLYISGNDGQVIITLPSKNAVIVHFGIIRAPADFKEAVQPTIQSITDKL